VTAARAWNALPSSVRSAPSLLQFRRDLKTALHVSVIVLFTALCPAVWQTVTFNTVRCPCNGLVREVSHYIWLWQYWEYIIEKAYEIHAKIYRGRLRWCLWLRRWRRCSVYLVGLCLLVYFYLYFVYYCLYLCSLPVYILVNKAVYIY